MSVAAAGPIFGVLLAVALPFVAIALLGGWTVPLILGILRKRRGRGGRGLIALGTAWGVLGLGGVVWIVYQIATLPARYAPEPFDPATYASETGNIVLSWDGPCELTLYPKKGDRRIELTAETGELIAPAGQHSIGSWTLKRTDSNGREWSAYGTPKYDPRVRTVNVSAAQPVQLSAGPPLTAHIAADRSGQDEISMNLTLKDASGASYRVMCAGERSAPKFEMCDAAGRVVWSGDFEYG